MTFIPRERTKLRKEPTCLWKCRMDQDQIRLRSHVAVYEESNPASPEIDDVHSQIDSNHLVSIIMDSTACCCLCSRYNQSRSLLRRVDVLARVVRSSGLIRAGFGGRVVIGSWRNSASDAEELVPVARPSFDIYHLGQCRMSFAACCQMTRSRGTGLSASEARAAGPHKTLIDVTAVGADG